jgi:hypothetical protein
LPEFAFAGLRAMLARSRAVSPPLHFSDLPGGFIKEIPLFEEN